jgi:hypothetical protein
MLVMPAGPIQSEASGRKRAKEARRKVRREWQEDIEMNQWRSKERNQRVRDILNAMDKSIDRAREKREEVSPALAVGGSLKSIRADGPTKEQGEPRLPSSMFDRKGPMLKARRKSNNSG